MSGRQTDGQTDKQTGTGTKTERRREGGRQVGRIAIAKLGTAYDKEKLIEKMRHHLHCPLTPVISYYIFIVDYNGIKLLVRNLRGSNLSSVTTLTVELFGPGRMVIALTAMAYSVKTRSFSSTCDVSEAGTHTLCNGPRLVLTGL